MQDWGSGYVTDLAYTEGFYPAQSPQRLALAAIVNGTEPPDVDRAFSYCELGSGRGLTTLILAAANPEAEFHGVDFNPAHIAHSQSQARAAGLTNIAWHEKSFGDLAGRGGDAFPMFDFITMHGVWTWIAPEMQTAVLEFIDTHLKPGGLLFVSYNGMPAWNLAAPIQRIVKELAALSPGRSDVSINRAIEMLDSLVQAKMIPPRFQEGVKRLTEGPHRQNLTYLAHEYLNEHWKPAYHADVARALATAKLSFVGCTSLLRNFRNLLLTEPQRALLDTLPNPELCETLKDFCVDQWFREDVYVRGSRRMTEERRDSLLKMLRLTMISPAPETIEISGPEDTIWRPDPGAYRCFIAALRQRPHTVGELLSLPGLPPDHKVSALELTSVLISCGFAAVSREPDRNAQACCERLNRLTEAEGEVALRRSATIANASIGLGVAMPSPMFDLYMALRRGESPDASLLARRFVKRCMDEGGYPIVEGKSYENEAEGLSAVERDYAMKIERFVPIWRAMGLI